MFQFHSHLLKSFFVIAFMTITLFYSDVKSQEWEAAAGLPATELGRNHPVTFEIDGFGYVVTGGTNLGASNDFYRYDPDLDEWEVLEAFPGPSRGFSYGVSHNGKGYLGFGLGENAPLNDLWEYNPATDSWRELASCPCAARWHPAFLANNGKLFVGTGSGGGQNLKDWWEYDIGIDNWVQRPEFPGARRHHPYHFSIDEYVYVAFGHGQSIYNDLYRYDPALMTWDRMADLPAEGRVAGTQFSAGGKGYALSGQGMDHDYLDEGEFWEYDPATNSWTQLPDHPGAGRWAPGSFVIDGYVYMIAGEDSNLNQRRDMFKYDLLGSSSIYQREKIEELAVFPNPTSGETQILSSKTIDQVSVFNALGLHVQDFRLFNNSLNISDFQNGQYTLHYVIDNRSYVSRITKN